MEGRWTIYKATGQFVDVITGPDGDSVPVVPCDDAAVERAALAISPDNPGHGRFLAELAFRAAGEGS